MRKPQFGEKKEVSCQRPPSLKAAQPGYDQKLVRSRNLYANQSSGHLWATVAMARATAIPLCPGQKVLSLFPISLSFALHELPGMDDWGTLHIIQLTGVLNRFMPCGSSSRNSASAQTHMPRKVAVVVEKVGYLPWAECGVPTKQQKDVQTCSTCPPLPSVYLLNFSRN